MPDQNDAAPRGGGRTGVGGGATGGGSGGISATGGATGGGGGERTDRPPAPAAANTKPAFEFEGNDQSENFNLKPREDLTSPIPGDQRKVTQDVYEARNVLKLLKEDEAFGTQATYDEFIKRVTQAGRAGCVAPYVDPGGAGSALEQIRVDIVRRVGTPLAYLYLRSLAGWALVGIGLALAVVIIGSKALPPIVGYGWVVIGAMLGAWFSVAASRWQIAFETIPGYLDRVYEPFVRMLFVGILGGAFALFLDLSILSIKIGNFDFADFNKSAGAAILVGFVAGIGERALSVQLLDRAQKILSLGKN